MLFTEIVIIALLVHGISRLLWGGDQTELFEVIGHCNEALLAKVHHNILPMSKSLHALIVDKVFHECLSITL